jgi:hypothetical protein
MATIYDAYGEDGDFTYMNGSVGSGIAVATAGNAFRNTANCGRAYARCAVGFQGQPFGYRFWQGGNGFTLSSGWVSTRVWLQSTNIDAPNRMFGLIDANGVPRIYIIPNANSEMSIFNVFKRDAAGNSTLLGTTSSGFTPGPQIPDKLDIQFDYSPSGLLKIYINRNMVFSVSNTDITTDGVTALGGTLHGNYEQSLFETTFYSECIVSDSDTRDMSLTTLAPTAAGTVDQWTGEVSNVNASIVNDANFDTTTTSGATQRYLAGQIAPGNYVIVAKVTSIRATQGGGSLTRLALDQLVSGAEHTSAPVPFPGAFGPVTFIEATSPATGAAWTQAELGSAAREVGVKALT